MLKNNASFFHFIQPTIIQCPYTIRTLTEIINFYGDTKSTVYGIVYYMGLNTFFRKTSALPKKFMYSFCKLFCNRRQLKYLKQGRTSSRKMVDRFALVGLCRANYLRIGAVFETTIYDQLMPRFEPSRLLWIERD